MISKTAKSKKILEPVNYSLVLLFFTTQMKEITT